MADAVPDGESLARDALEWLLGQAREHGAGLAWPGRTGDDELDPTLYSGTAGIVVAFLEGYAHFGDDRYAVAAVRGARALAAADEGRELSSLALGLAGRAFALHAMCGMLADNAAGEAAARALGLVRSRFTGSAGAISSSCSGATRASPSPRSGRVTSTWLSWR
jgi:hypothetical protein